MKSKPVLLAQLLISYFILMLLPFMVIACYFYPLITQYSMDQIETNNRNFTEQIQFNTEQIIKSITDLCNEIDHDGVFRSYSLQSSYDVMNSIKRFKQYMSNAPYIYASAFYFKENDTVYTATTTFKLEDIGRDAFIFRNWSSDSIHHDLSSLVKPVIRPSDDVLATTTSRVVNPAKVITFVIPVRINSSHPYGVFMILVRESLLFSGTSLYNNDYEGNVIIVDNNNHVIDTLGKKEISEDDIREILAESPLEKMKELTINDKRYVVSSIVSSLNGWNYINVIPRDVALAQLSKMKNTSLIMLSLLILIEGSLIYISYKRNYLPIRNLVKLLSPGDSVTAHEKARLGEIDFIEERLNTLNDTNRKLKSESIDSAPLIKEYLLQRLICGDYASREDFNKAGGQYGADLRFDTIAIAVFAFICDNETRNIKGICLQDDIFNRINEIQVYLISDIYKERMIAILCYNDFFEEKTKDIVHQIRNYFARYYDFKIFTGVGKSVSRIKNLEESYNQAEYMCQYSIFKSSNSILDYRDFEKSLVIQKKYDQNLIYKLKYAIVQRDIAKITSYINEILSNMADEATPMHITRLLFNDVRQLVSDEIQKLSKGHPDKDTETINPFVNNSNHSVYDYQDDTRKSSDYLIRLIQLDTESKKYRIEDIIIYIDANYLRYDFSIQKVADHFNLSMSNFSSFFKNRTGETFSNYVNNLRIEKAKHLLTHTADPVADISFTLGYSNASSFCRCFKSEVGLSPGEFRKKYVD